MELKSTVKLHGLDWEKMADVISCADKFCSLAGRLEGCTITSALDGDHSANSLHYSGLALDLRIRYFTPAVNKAYATYLKTYLGPDYDVVLERTHIHVEYDPDG